MENGCPSWEVKSQEGASLDLWKGVLIFLIHSAAVADDAINGQELTLSFSEICHAVGLGIPHHEKPSGPTATGGQMA